MLSRLALLAISMITERLLVATGVSMTHPRERLPRMGTDEDVSHYVHASFYFFFTFLPFRPLFPREFPRKFV